MHRRRRIDALAAGLGLALAFPVALSAQSTQMPPEEPSPSRIPTQPFQSIRNSRSAVEFFATNYGTFGHDGAKDDIGLFWPRGSRRGYVYGAGIWIGARKRVNDELVKLSTLGYNPNSGLSWFTPGRFDSPEPSANVDRLYLSTEYDARSGDPLDPVDRASGGANWPVWALVNGMTPGLLGYTGTYLYDTNARHLSSIEGMPVVGSAEDLLAIYHDRDTIRYEGQTMPGHPLGVQIEQSIYSWNEEPFDDVVMIRYRTINVSSDTLFDTYIGLALDADIGNSSNDRAKIAIENRGDDSLDLSVTWSEAIGGDDDYGYLGLDLLESPIVDDSGFIRPLGDPFTLDDQLGIATLQNWSVEEDPATPAERYDFISAHDRDPDYAPGDKRQLMATGPFHLAPGETATVTFGVMLARPVGSSAIGTWADMANLLELDRVAQSFFEAKFIRNAVQFSSIPPGSPQERDQRVSVAPIPATTMASISVDILHASAARLVIVAIDGRTVVNRDLGRVASGTLRVPIDVASLAPGAYVVLVESAGGVDRGMLLVGR